MTANAGGPLWRFIIRTAPHNRTRYYETIDPDAATKALEIGLVRLVSGPSELGRLKYELTDKGHAWLRLQDEYSPRHRKAS